MKKTILGLCCALSFQMLVYKGYQLNDTFNIEEKKTTTSQTTIEYNNEITITPVSLLKKDVYHHQQKIITQNGIIQSLFIKGWV